MHVTGEQQDVGLAEREQQVVEAVRIGLPGLEVRDLGARRDGLKALEQVLDER